MRTALFVLILAVGCTIARADVVYGANDDGWVWGATALGGTGVGLLIAPDGTRYEFPQWRVIENWTHGVNRVVWQDWHVTDIPRYETDCLPGINNFDIDAFVIALLSGEPSECGAFVYTNDDVDVFVRLLGVQ